MKSERRTLDHQLIFEARRMITGANVHRMKELIFAYEEAIDLHNRAWPAHRKYRREHEVRLRSYVIKLRKLDRNRTRDRLDALCNFR